MTDTNSLAPEVQSVDATRSVDETELSPGESTTVELSVGYEEELGEQELLRITDEFSPGFGDVETISILPGGGEGGSGPDNEEYLAVWKEDADTYTVSYDVTIPGDATDGEEFDISGTLELGDEEEPLPDATIIVDTDITGMSLQPATETVEPGSQLTFDFVASGADEGVGSYSASITSSDPAVGSITDVSLTGDVDTDGSNVAEDGSSALVEAEMTTAHEGAGEITIAEVTIDTDEEEEGTSEFAVDDATLSDSTRTEYELEFVDGATVTVSGEPTLDDYTDDEGVAEASDVFAAIDDWRAGEIEPGLVFEVIDAWRG